jgi:hypothetical protein
MAGMMAPMRANDAKLDALVKKVQAATGAAKTDAWPCVTRRPAVGCRRRAPFLTES